MKTINLSAPWPQYRNTHLSSILQEEGEQSILVSKRNSVLFLTGLWSHIFRKNIFPSLWPSTNSFPHFSPTESVLPSLPVCSRSLLPAVPIREWCFLICTFLLPLWENVFPQIWHWWGFTPWRWRGKKYPKNYKLGNKDLINQETNNTVLKWLLTALLLIISKKKKKKDKYSCFLESNKVLEQKSFIYQYCQLLENSSLKSNIKSSSLIYEREQVTWNLLLTDMEMFDVPCLE